MLRRLGAHGQGWRRFGSPLRHWPRRARPGPCSAKELGPAAAVSSKAHLHSFNQDGGRAGRRGADGAAELRHRHITGAPRRLVAGMPVRAQASRPDPARHPSGASSAWSGSGKGCRHHALAACRLVHAVAPFGNLRAASPVPYQRSCPKVRIAQSPMHITDETHLLCIFCAAVEAHPGISGSGCASVQYRY